MVATTLCEALAARARETPDALALRFLVDGDATEATLTVAALDRRARAIAATLVEATGPTNDRVLLLYDPGLDYVAGFFGCLYAGKVAVPAYPPDPGRPERTIPRLRAILADADATGALTTASFLAFSRLVGEGAADLQKIRWIASDTLPAGAEASFRAPSIDPHALAWLQYTSGSTSAPRGVMVSHANAIVNTKMIAAAAGIKPGDGFVNWLPPFHDMGLVGALLTPIVFGAPATIFAPIDFLRRPLRWLEALSRYRASHTIAPNFAFDLAARKATPEALATYDLSNLRAVYNGAEPIRAETIDRFSEVFAPSGLRRTSWLPCYGLAEATLMVSGTHGDPLIRSVDAPSLERGRVVVVPDDLPGARRLVGSGAPQEQLAIVDAETRNPCRSDEVGEIWLAGPSIAQGYWRRPDANAETFDLDLAGTSGARGAWMRTGDIGFLEDGQLFVSGRSKDLVIIHGRNHHPQEIEATIEHLPGVRPGCTAAFPIEVAGEERLAIVAEVDAASPTLAQQIVAAVVTEHDLAPAAIAFLPPRSIFKTSSGKIQRQACKQAFLADTLKAAHVWREASTDTLAAPPKPRTGVIDDLLATLARVTRRPAASFDPTVPLAALGVDSISALELEATIAKLGVAIPATELLQLSLDALAQRIASRLAGA